MCECGCGELQPIAKLRAPNGDWYALEVYPGCQYCDTSWALGVTKVAKDDRDLMELLDDVPEATFSQYGQWGHPILNTQVLVDMFAKEQIDAAPEEKALRGFIGLHGAGGAEGRQMEAHLDNLATAADARFAIDEFVNAGGLRDVFYATQKASGGAPARVEADDDADDEDDYEFGEDDA